MQITETELTYPNLSISFRVGAEGCLQRRKVESHF